MDPRRKCRAIPVVSRPDEPPRLNLVMTGGQNSMMTGGPLCIFQWAVQMATHGFNVRFLTLASKGLQGTALCEVLSSREGLEKIGHQIEFVHGVHDDPSFVLPCNPSDFFVGTLYYTALVAASTQRLLNAKPFLYFIQDYEPNFFANGSEHVLACESYDLPHRALFSTHFLRKYFQQAGIGVFAAKNAEWGGDGTWSEHEPAITVPPQIARQKPRSRVIVYARPQTDRNAYDLSVGALWLAIEAGAFPADSWDILGVGSLKPDQVQLPRGQSLKLCGYLDEKEYVDLVRTGDVGLSLMITPHPSLPPLDFAVAGMITVTNAWLTKTAADFAAISSNFVVAEPSRDAIAAALRIAEQRAGDRPSRVNGAALNWANTWAHPKCYGEPAVQQLREWTQFAPESKIPLDLEIRSASYHGKDVTESVRKLVAVSGGRFKFTQEFNQHFGDPAFGVAKKLRVVYRKGRGPWQRRKFREHEWQTAELS